MNKFLIAITVVLFAFNSSQAQNQDSSIKGVKFIVEEPASFPGGEADLFEYIMRNFKYPKEARKMHVKGKVYVSFKVDREGKVRDAKVIKGIGAGCDEEALRVVNSMPDWKPGLQNGIPVDEFVNVPVEFYDK